MSGVALVTGSSRGIGRATAIALARAGFSVAVNGPVADAELDAAVAAVTAASRDAVMDARAETGRDAGTEAAGKVCAAPFDVADLSAHEAALAAIEDRLGPLTTLVNNAGVGVLHRGDPLDVSEESWDRCMAVNAKGSFFLTQAFAKRLLARDRVGFHAIVNVTSANATAVAVPRAEYAASKAAAAMNSQMWAVRLGAAGIAVYDIRPGLIETDLTAPVIADYKTRAADGLTLIPRVGQPEEVGQIIATLARGDMPYTTGQVISADGGMLVPRF